MLELARGISQWAGFKHAVIFLFNTGEEEGLNGAHSFITQVGSIFIVSSNCGFLFLNLFSYSFSK
jgi:putative aminopeptidase FrvX